jgi:hypothetical protein
VVNGARSRVRVTRRGQLSRGAGTGTWRATGFALTLILVGGGDVLREAGQIRCHKTFYRIEPDVGF